MTTNEADIFIEKRAFHRLSHVYRFIDCSKGVVTNQPTDMTVTVTKQGDSLTCVFDDEALYKEMLNYICTH